MEANRTPHRIEAGAAATRIGFADRSQAGRVLAQDLEHYAGQPGLVVLALPRGGVPVAYEVARELEAPLDVFVVRKIGVPGQRELAMGAIASGGVVVTNDEVVTQLDIAQSVFDQAAAEEQAELQRREALYRAHARLASLESRTVILIDDGLATGSTMRAAIEALRQSGPAFIVVAVPVACSDIVARLRHEADEVVCSLTPDPFHAVGFWYGDFTQTTDDQVRDLLRRASSRSRPAH
jgi:putative phosphoribosyl transferase